MPNLLTFLASVLGSCPSAPMKNMKLLSHTWPEPPEQWGTHVGTETQASYTRWLNDGFLENYLSGDHILDIGYKGYGSGATPITPWAVGIDLEYPGYDGRTLPFPDGSQDTVFSSHCLEHIDDFANAISDWFRVLRIGGHLVILVPHQYLYERKLMLPSLWNGDHKRFYTAATLFREIEKAIDPACFRIRLLEDNDRSFNYAIPPEEHAQGRYELVLVIQKIERPAYFAESHGKSQAAQWTFMPEEMIRAMHLATFGDAPAYDLLVRYTTALQQHPELLPKIAAAFYMQANPQKAPASAE